MKECAQLEKYWIPAKLRSEPKLSRNQKLNSGQMCNDFMSQGAFHLDLPAHFFSLYRRGASYNSLSFLLMNDCQR